MENAIYEWALAELKGMLSSSLRSGTMGKSTLPQIDGIIRRVRSYGASEIEVKEAIAAGIDQSPNRTSAEADELRKRYLQ